MRLRTCEARKKIYYIHVSSMKLSSYKLLVVGTLWLFLDLGRFIGCLQIAILALAGIFWYIRSYQLIICFSPLFMLLLTLFWPFFTPSPPPNFSKGWMFVHAISFTPQKTKKQNKQIQQEHPEAVLQRDRDRSCVSACWIPTFSPPPEATMIQDDEQTLDSGSDIFQRYTGIWTNKDTHVRKLGKLL